MTTDESSLRASRSQAALRWLLAAAAALVVGATGSAVWMSATDGGATPVADRAPVPVPALAVAGEGADGRVAWSAPLTLTLTDGELLEVAVRTLDETPVVGTLVDGGTWRSAGTLLPDAPYSVMAKVRDGAGTERWQPTMATTVAAEDTVQVALSPGDGAVVGVGMPVVVRLDTEVDDPDTRARLVERLEVLSTPAVEGAWRWMHSKELHYRPEQFWAPGTAISVRADLDRLPFPDGAWGSGVRTSSYTVGDALVSTVDVEAKTMTVRRNGEVLRVLPASMGKPEFPTRGGVHLVLEKEASKVMDSDTVGLPGEYRTEVEWAVRLTYSGTFTHSAPWSVKDQGVRNVSHGCINLSPADAKWFYDQARRGDVVEVVNSPVGPKLSDPGASDWNLSFAEWKSGAGTTSG